PILPSTLIPGTLSCLRKSSHRSVTVPPPVSLRSRTGWDPQHVNRVALAIQRSEKCPRSKPVHHRAALGGNQRAPAPLRRGPVQAPTLGLNSRTRPGFHRRRRYGLILP